MRSWAQAVAVGLTATLLAAGCGHDTEADSTNRGSGTDTEQTSVDNVYIVPRSKPGACAIQVEDAAELRFAVANNRPLETERLLEITSDDADAIQVIPPPPLEIAPESRIAAGQPIEQLSAPSSPDRPLHVTVDGLDESVRPGLAVDVTFRFEQQGDITMRVPVEACPRQIEVTPAPEPPER